MLRFNQLTLAEQKTRLIELANLALIHWGLEGVLRLIKHRENAVYELNTLTGERFALRIHREGYHSDRSLKSELLWMEALRESGIDVPTVIPNLNGHSFTRISVPGLPGERQVDVLSWVNGEQISSKGDGLGNDPQTIGRIYKAIGRLAAKMHNQAVQWELPQEFERHAWDFDGLVGDNPLWGRFWELPALSAKQQQLVFKAREIVRQQLLAYGQSRETYSLIHADFVRENFLVDGSKVHVIDFDDAGFGWHLFDLATALYSIQDNPGYGTARTALIDGYREFRSLPDAMIEQLPLFSAARSFTYLGWVQTRQNTETARELTQRLIEMCCRACGQL